MVKIYRLSGRVEAAALAFERTDFQRADLVLTDLRMPTMRGSEKGSKKRYAGIVESDSCSSFSAVMVAIIDSSR